MTAPAAPPRVAVIHNLPSPYRLPLFEALGRKVTLRVFFLARGAPNRTWQAPGALGFDAEWLRPVSVRLPGQEYRGLLANPGVVPALRRFRPEVVVLGGYDSLTSLAALAYCRLARIPVVLWSGSTARESAGRRASKEFLKRRIVRACQAYIAYGTRASEYLQSLGAPPGRIAISPNTVDIEFFAAAARDLEQASERTALGLALDRPVVLFSGQLIDRKDPLALVAALGQLRRHGLDSQLLVVGDGPLRAAVEETAAALGVATVFAGAVPPGHMPRYYVAADVLVLPSREEIWGLVANEAMACGRAVIISDACGAAVDLVEDGVSGAVFPAGDVPALEASLRGLLGNRARLQAMGDAARHRVREFSIERAAAGFMEGVELALGRGH